MGRFLNGVLVGVGIGLLVAPMKGEEMRHLVRERYEELRSGLPDNEQLKQAGQQIAAGVSQTASQLKDYTQQAVSKAKDTGSSLGDLAQQATREVKQTGQDVASTTKKTAQSMKQGEQTATKSRDAGAEEEIIFVDDMALDEDR
jgi:gas vesicle protein